MASLGENMDTPAVISSWGELTGRWRACQHPDIFFAIVPGYYTGCRRFPDDAGQRAMSSLRQAGLLSADDPVSQQEVVGRLYLT